MKHSDGKNSCGMCCTKLKELTVRFGQNIVLHDINLHIHCGELTVIIGPNGAGKSTLFKAIIGNVRHSGEIVFTDFQNRQTGTPKIGYVPQMLEIDRNAPISVLDLFTMTRKGSPVFLGNSKKTMEVTEKILSSVGAEKLTNRRLGALSGGEMQRVMLALALSNEPEVLLLDEPVAGVDNKGLGVFYNILDRIKKNFDLTIMIISHDHERIAKYADRFVLLDKTILCEGVPSDVLSSPQYLELFSKGDV